MGHRGDLFLEVVRDIGLEQAWRSGCPVDPGQVPVVEHAIEVELADPLPQVDAVFMTATDYSPLK